MKKLLALSLLFGLGAFAQDGQIKLSADIQNRNSDTLYIRSRADQKILVSDKKGHFSETLNVNPGLYQLYDGTEYAVLYLDNGYDLFIKLDAKKFDESLKFSGKGAAENNWLAKKMMADETFRENMDDLPGDPAAISAIIEERGRKLAAGLENTDMSQSFRDMMKQVLQQEDQQIKVIAARAMEEQKMKGKPSPLFVNYKNHKGGTTSLADLKGKYVYIDVWATWCGPCRQQIPHLKEVEKKYHGKNIEFVSISVDKLKDHDKWVSMVTKEELGGVQLFADNDFRSDFVKAYGINSIPRFILLDPKGNVVRSDAPRPSDPKLQLLLDKLLK